MSPEKMTDPKRHKMGHSETRERDLTAGYSIDQFKRINADNKFLIVGAPSLSALHLSPQYTSTYTDPLR